MELILTKRILFIMINSALQRMKEKCEKQNDFSTPLVPCVGSCSECPPRLCNRFNATHNVGEIYRVLLQYERELE
jgi:hypothetical protein